MLLGGGFGAGVYGLDTAVAQHDHAVGLGGKVGVVGDDDEGLAEFVAQIEEELVKALLIRRVKAPRWFVGEDDRRRIDEARATATRWLSPPDSSAGLCEARSARPRRSRSPRARSRTFERDSPAMRAGSITFSSAVNSGRSWCAWKMKPIWRLRELGLTAGAEAGDFLPTDLQRSTFGRGFECAEDSGVGSSSQHRWLRRWR